jgi:hypothetical protein|tara:strand:+ start:329 stop:1957 length:1629 start_codon:yes stop_codon:yes gene_type:complete
MPRRQGVRGGSTRADGTLVQGAATAFGPTVSVGAGVAQGFQSTFMDTFKYVKAEKDKDYARVEEEFYKTFDQVEALQKDYNVLNKDQQNLLQPWLRNKKQELYDIKKKMQNAPRNQRDALRIEMNDILSTVQRSAGSMEGMSNYFNELSTLAENGGVSDANGIINPDKAKNTFNFALGNSYDFDQDTGTFNYETEIYQKAIETADAFFTDTAKGYEYGKQTGLQLTDTEIDLKKQYYNKNLNENDVISLLFDDFAFNDDGYYHATMKSDKVNAAVRSEYKRNFEMLKKGRGTEEYKDAIKFFKEQVAEKLTEGYRSRAEAGASEFKAPDDKVNTTPQEKWQYEASVENNRVENLTKQVGDLGQFNPQASDGYINSLKTMYPNNKNGAAANWTYDPVSGMITLVLTSKDPKSSITDTSATSSNVNEYVISPYNILGSLVNLNFEPSFGFEIPTNQPNDNNTDSDKSTGDNDNGFKTVTIGDYEMETKEDLDYFVDNTKVGKDWLKTKEGKEYMLKELSNRDQSDMNILTPEQASRRKNIRPVQ